MGWTVYHQPCHFTEITRTTFIISLNPISTFILRQNTQNGQTWRNTSLNSTGNIRYWISIMKPTETINPDTSQFHFQTQRITLTIKVLNIRTIKNLRSFLYYDRPNGTFHNRTTITNLTNIISRMRRNSPVYIIIRNLNPCRNTIFIPFIL